MPEEHPVMRTVWATCSAIARRRYRAPAVERPGLRSPLRARYRPRGPAPDEPDGPGFTPPRGPGRTGVTFGYMYWCVVMPSPDALPGAVDVPFVTVRRRPPRALVVEHSSLRSADRITAAPGSHRAGGGTTPSGARAS